MGRTYDAYLPSDASVNMQKLSGKIN